MYGRNELIARYIKLRTGKTRTRKQVSSHIQVLARKRVREYQASIKDQVSKDKALQTVANLSSAQIVSASVMKSQASFPPPVRFWPGHVPGQPGHSQDIKPFAQPPYTTLAAAPVPAPISYESLAPPRPAAIAAPVWQDRTIASAKLRLLEYSAFMETQKDREMYKHLFVHIGPSNPSYSDPVLESIDVRQIYDKFSEKKGGLKELYENGPHNAFFLVKFWADLSSDLEEGSSAFYGVSSQYSGTENITISVSTKVCSFGKQVVEKVETEYAHSEGGKHVFRIHRSPMCEYMINFIHKLKHLPEKYMMNSVLENFTILQVIRSERTSPAPIDCAQPKKPNLKCYVGKDRILANKESESESSLLAKMEMVLTSHFTSWETVIPRNLKVSTVDTRLELFHPAPLRPGWSGVHASRVFVRTFRRALEAQLNSGASWFGQGSVSNDRPSTEQEMMLAEPLRSAMTIGRVEDTSLALPSDARLHTGAHRVLNQVQTIKRSKSKHGKNGTPTSPTVSPLSPLDEFGTFQFLPTKANGTFGRSVSTKSAAYNKAQYAQKSRSLSTKSLGARHLSTTGGWEQQINASNWPQSPGGMKPSRSDPALAPASIRRAKGQTTQTQVKRLSTYSTSNGYPTAMVQQRFLEAPPDQSQFIKTSRMEQQSAINSSLNASDLTIKEAVEFLSHPEEKFQQCGATIIQQTTFKDDRAKQEVLQLGGIPTLVTLLRSPSPAVSQAAAGALRNLVFKNHKNKLQVQHCGGIAKALQLLKETDCSETQKQITGLLWNLSSADELKGELIATALPALTENVVVPFTRWSDDSVTNNIHPEVFYNTTGCLRNLSCAQVRERTAMRDCRGLIDSLMCYLQSCVADNNPDDKSVENCACILHNLTYQLETESPKCFADFIPSTESQSGRRSPTVGCFSPKSGKVQKQFSFDNVRGMLKEGDPTGAKWLCHPKAMQTYLSLLSSSQKDATLEACCGALQNLTASKDLGSSAMSQILVQKLGALMHIAPLLRSPKSSLQKAAVSLLGNIGRTGGLQATMAKQVLPELTSLLAAGPRELGNSDENIATACNTVRNLMMADTEVNKKFIDADLVSSLADLSGNGSFPKASKAASVLLYHLWNDKNLQSILKKIGMSKSLFVNDSTTAAYRSVQIIE